MRRLELLRRQGLLSEVDAQLGRLLLRLHPDMGPEAALAAACASHALHEGHTCLPLTQVGALLQQAKIPGQWPDAGELRHRLLTSGAARAAAESLFAPAPLVLDSADRLALLRLYRAEAGIAADLAERAQGLSEVDTGRAGALLRELFPDTAPADPSLAPEPSPNLQKRAAALALCKRLLILCGGPGTGKTHTLARILALIMALAQEPPRVALAAPTGRAAMRLGEAIRQAAANLPAAYGPHSMPQPQTLHRLLGFQPHSGTFLCNAANLLHVDLLVVDEASMVDVSLLQALLAALPARSRLIICGDPDQLPPVEPGGLLHVLRGLASAPYSPELRRRLRCLCDDSDLEGEEEGAGTGPADTLAECRITLQRVHRFAEQSGMLALARALREPQAFARALPGPWPDVRIYTLKEARLQLSALLLEVLEPLARAGTVQEALAALDSCRVLCALREGPWGVAGINARCRELLQPQERGTPRQELYQGLPILILRNEYAQGLYNGDTGVLWPDATGELRAWFHGDDGLRSFVPAALPPWQPAYAMTVHKAQGAEFASVLLVLPAEDSPLLSRELLYTAITRARERLVMIADRELLQRIASRQLERHSLLGGLLLDSRQGRPEQINGDL